MENEQVEKKELKPMICAACGYKTTITMDIPVPTGDPVMVDGQMATPVRMVYGAKVLSN